MDISFRKMWSILNISPEDFFLKSSDKLSEKELREIQNVIRDMQKKGMNASKIIKYLQNHNDKLRDKNKAERAFWTELKRLDTKQVSTSGKYLDLDKYRVILSPHACEVCRKKTNDGRKIFKSSDLEKDGYGHIPPFHPNCYCVLIPA